MKKRVFGRKFSRGSGGRRALFRSLIRALVSEGSIVTTLSKAKTVRHKTEKMVSLTKKGGVEARRRVYSLLGNDRDTTDSLFDKIAPNFKDRAGGYLRIVKLPSRRGDAVGMARLEWVKEIEGTKSFPGKKVEKDGTVTKKTLKSQGVQKKGRESSRSRTGIRGLLKRRSA
ncbi:50S ribosomal protein L17 [Patescibacteria group bacterium]|nr:50S ribosomal protein L17 [Patescibacteria group bacterium]